jgi:hypothetical protein
MMRKFPGTIGASRTPSNTLKAMRVSKFFANPVPMRTIPQIIGEVAIVLAIGSFWRRLPAGKHQIR